MHAVFWLHGKKELVDRAIKWLETRYFYMPFQNPDLKPHGPRDKDGNLISEGVLPIDGVLRYGLFGTWELVFPKESMDEVLTTLNFHNFIDGYSYKGRTKLKARTEAMRLALGCDKIPKFKKDKKLHMPEGLLDHITVIPIGIRHDRPMDVHGVTCEGL